MRVATGGRISSKTSLNPYVAAYKKERRDMTPYYAGAVRTRRTRGSAMQPYKRVPNQPRARYSRTRKMTYNVSKSAAGSTFSRLVFGSKRVPKALYSLYKNNQEYIDENIISKRVSSIFGKQTVTISALNDQSQLTAMILTIPGLSTPTLSQTGKFILQNVRSKMTFTNQDLATAYVQVYSLVPRFHVPAGNNPLIKWDVGLENQSLVPATNDQYQDPYAAPFASQDFCLFYKVDKITTFELGQGQSHCHDTTYHINKEVYGQLINTFGSLRDITKFNMVVVSGTPINDNTNKSLVSTSSCAVDIVEHIVKEYTYAAAQRKVRFYTNSLSTITTAEIVSIGAGLVVNEDEA